LQRREKVEWKRIAIELAVSECTSEHHVKEPEEIAQPMKSAELFPLVRIKTNLLSVTAYDEN